MILEFTVGIGTNLVTDLIKHGGKRFLDDTRLGTRLKEKLGLLDNTTEDEFRKVLLESYVSYFSRYPERQFQVFYDFFASDEVSQRLFRFVFDLQPIDYGELENALQSRMGKDWILFRILERDNLTVRKVIDDFINCYVEVEKKSVGLGLLLVSREIRESEQRIAQRTAVELKDTGDRIISSVIGSLGSHLIALEDELKRLGINSKDILAFHSLGRDARRIESALHELQVHLAAIVATAENLSSDVARIDGIPANVKDGAKDVLALSLMLHYTVLNVMGYEDIAGYRFQKLNIGTILRSVAKVFEPFARHRNVVILIKSKEKHFPMLEVSSPIELAINNLIHNAVKYSLSGTSDEPRKVMISGEPSGAYYKISIKDYGVPIPADEYDKVFEDGYQSATAKEVFPTGMGRGLHVAKTIISRHHGTIRVFSNQEEGGFSTTVEMYLPYNQPTPKVGS